MEVSFRSFMRILDAWNLKLEFQEVIWKRVSMPLSSWLERHDIRLVQKYKFDVSCLWDHWPTGQVLCSLWWVYLRFSAWERWVSMEFMTCSVSGGERVDESAKEIDQDCSCLPASYPLVLHNISSVFYSVAPSSSSAVLGLPWPSLYISDLLLCSYISSSLLDSSGWCLTSLLHLASIHFGPMVEMVWE